MAKLILTLFLVGSLAQYFFQFIEKFTGNLDHKYFHSVTKVPFGVRRYWLYTTSKICFVVDTQANQCVSTFMMPSVLKHCRSPAFDSRIDLIMFILLIAVTKVKTIMKR